MGFEFLIAGLVISALSAGFGAYSQFQQGAALSRQSSLNAYIAQRNAALAEEKMQQVKMATSLEVDKFRNAQKRLLAEQTVGYAKASVGPEGTPLYVAAETKRQADIDELAIKYAGDVKYAQVLADAAENRMKAMQLKAQSSTYATAGWLNAGTTLLSGLGTAFTGFGTYYDKFNTPSKKNNILG